MKTVAIIKLSMVKNETETVHHHSNKTKERFPVHLHSMCIEFHGWSSKYYNNNRLTDIFLAIFSTLELHSVLNHPEWTLKRDNHDDDELAGQRNHYKKVL